MVWAIQNNTYIQQVKTDPKDRTEIEIGDMMQPNFLPQVKIKRWDNEVNFSARLVHNELNPTITTEVDKIKWQGKKIEAHFYDIEPCAEHPEGGFEFEVILKEKPVSNKIEFTLQTKGLDFFYQPELTQEEKDEGAFRPENVVGSYAVYHSTKGAMNNVVGGKLYRVGKFGHIYRPKVIDNAGNWTWGILNIDNGILSVEIPQRFLDEAVYPIRHATGLTFGITAHGLSSEAGWNKILGPHAGSPASNGTADSITVYASFGAGTYYENAAIYLDSDDTLIASTTEQGFAGTVNEYTFAFASPPSIFSASSYLLVLNGEFHYLYNDAATGEGATQASTYDSPYTWPSPLSLGVANKRYSIYCTYEAAAGGLSIPVAMHHYKMMRN